MSTTSAPKHKNCGSKPMATHAVHDINLSDNLQNILPEDAQRLKKGSEKWIAHGKY